MNISQSEFSSLKSIRQLLMIKTKQMKYSCMKVMNMDLPINDSETELVRFTVYVAFLYACTGHPHGKGINVMISACSFS